MPHGTSMFLATTWRRGALCVCTAFSASGHGTRTLETFVAGLAPGEVCACRLAASAGAAPAMVAPANAAAVSATRARLENERVGRSSREAITGSLARATQWWQRGGESTSTGSAYVQAVMPGVPEIDVREVPDPLPDGLTLLDVREPHEWDQGHIDGALHIPMMSVPAELAAIPSDGQVVVVCAVGARSARVAAFLQQQGVDAVNLAGGMVAWARAGRPISVAGSPAHNAGDDW